MCLIFLYASFQGEGEKSYSNEPCSKGYLPISKSTSILLPAPFSPTIAICSPFLISNEVGTAIRTSALRGNTPVILIEHGPSTMTENLPLFFSFASNLFSIILGKRLKLFRVLQKEQDHRGCPYRSRLPSHLSPQQHTYLLALQPWQLHDGHSAPQ